MSSRIFNIILVLIFAILIALYGYKNTRQPIMLKAPINNHTDIISDSKIDQNDSSAVTSRAELNEAIREYIMNNPEEIMSSLESMQEKKAQKSLEKTSNYLKENRSAIENEDSPPVLGDLNGDVTIVVFYDYTCSFCKKSNEYMNQIMKSDAHVKFILRPIPILSGNSMYVTKVALAIEKISKDKFHAIHNELIEMKLINEETIKNLIAKHGIDYSMVENEINSYSIKQSIAKNFELAKALGVQGAPSYVINGHFLPGLVSVEKFQTIILQARSMLNDDAK
jgi:protein-disulfide isomerase